MRKFLSIKDKFAEQPQWDANCWVNVECPDQDDFEFLQETLRIPEEFLEDIADIDERPRTESEGDWKLIILRIPMRNTHEGLPFSTVPIGVIAGKDVLVTVCYFQTEMLSDFVHHVRRKNIEITTKSDFILRIIYSSAYWFQKYLKSVYNQVNDAEKELEKSIRNEDLLQLMKLQKSLVFFNTSLRGNEMMIGRLKKGTQGSNSFNPDLVEDVVIELKQAYNTVNIYSDILTGTMDAFASIISNNVNAIMKRMTSISITLMIPTLIASFYGMNVSIDYGSGPYAFFGIILISALLSAVSVIWFRKIKWF
ncbi:MAG: magnesium transporter CorA family protein [Mediterranea sp.]|jgi:magnesium transporter|nr:magnesium transporter CorA family protein [Mediterranea sp.]